MATEQETTSRVPSFSIAWRHLQVQTGGGWCRPKKRILCGLVGGFTTGTLHGLVGPSGSGKTTLLNCLSGTVTTGLTEGSEVYIKVAGQTGGQLPPVSYYIKQHVQESIVGELTVGQILRYAGAFKNEAIKRTEMEKHIATTMDALMLPAELTSRPFARCSGGEQKRIAIAQELMALSPPAFLFVDEPTTGLDSHSAYEVMSCLRRLATMQGITVIASIHSPNDETLQLFSSLYVLAKGGLCVYAGPPAGIGAVLEQELSLTVALEQPPIEALLKIACNGASNRDVLRLARHVHLQATEHVCSRQLSSTTDSGLGLQSRRKSFNLSNLWTHLARQLRVAFLAQWRTTAFVPMAFLAYFATVSTIYNLKMSTSTGCYPLADTPNRTCTHEERLEADDLVEANSYFLIWIVVWVALVQLTTTVSLHTRHLQGLASEHRNHWFGLAVFYVSSAVVGLLEATSTALSIALCSYFLTQQHAADAFALNWLRFGYFSLFIWLLCLYSQAVGHLLAVALLHQPAVAIIAAQILYTACCLFNEVYLDLDRTGSWTLGAIRELLALAYITRGLFYAIYGIGRCHLETEYSWVLPERNVEPERLVEYIVRVLGNVLAIKLATLVVMYCKFNGGRVRPHKGAPLDIDDLMEVVPIEEEISRGEQALREQSPRRSRSKCIAIGWRHLSLYSSDSLFQVGNSSQGHRSLLLRRLHGQLHFGTLTALMGTSGAGKTSLLRVLNGQCKSRLSDQTAIYLSRLTRVRTCFITQEVSGHLMAGLTARQTLYYASRLKNAGGDVDHEAIALRWLTELDLLNTVDTKVEHCSGGERKRLAVALELTSLVMPNLICIDEPTSGLDSNSAEMVISSLRQLVLAHPIAIVTSIHQPTADILALFDQLYVLARGGVCIYSGPASQIAAHLEQSLGPASAVGPFPIETLIKYSSCSTVATSGAVQQLATVQEARQLASSSELSAQTVLVPDGVMANRVRFSVHSIHQLGRRYLHYIVGHLWPQWLLFLCTSIAFATAIRCLYPVAEMITIDGCIDFEDDDTNSCTKTAADREEESLLKDNLAYTLVYSNVYMLVITLTASYNFCLELPHFLNEHRNGYYSTGVWYAVKSLSELLLIWPTLLLYVAIIDVYAPVVPGGLYRWLALLLALSTAAMCSMAHCISLLEGGCAFSLRTIILLLTNFALWLILDNTSVRIEEMHYFWQLVANFSIARHLFAAIVLLQYGFGRCRPRQLQAVLHFVSVEDGDYWPTVGWLVFNLLLFRVLALVLLIRRANGGGNSESHQKRMARIGAYMEKLRGR